MSETTYAVGMRIEARDEVWVVSEAERVGTEGWRLAVTGVSPLVREQSAVFFTGLEDEGEVTPLRPEDTELVVDDTQGFRRSRLYWEAVLRATPLPQSQRALATIGTHLVDDLPYQREPARVALVGLRPRILIADAVGLGKTLEIGLLLSELIRRGRGERILVVTPRHILEQFQHELWTRFAIPLVRLDSEGIARVRRRIPAGRNPFTYYKRAIISIDTVKSSQYRHALKGIEWDAVVIDESHKLVNVGAKNNELARVLAPNTHALILASATPHNGRKESFGELISLLDPAAIPDTADYGPESINGLYVRRHKTSPDVEAAIGDQWMQREPPKFLYAKASAAEEAVFEELYETWISPPVGVASPVTGKGARLFPYTLLKSFLSSHAALTETIANRLNAIAEDEKKNHTDRRAEKQALVKLRTLVNAITPADNEKFQHLVSELEGLSVRPGSDARVVIFSERRATLNFLLSNLPAALGFPASSGKGDQGAVRLLHGGLPDTEQQANVKDFGLADSPLRILLAGDIASEGVNLHRQCNQLVHYDVPWSLITLEQRNGRIDRYGQLKHPQFRVLLHVRGGDDRRQDADYQVSKRLAEREYEVHRTFGDAAAVMGLYDALAEEDTLREAHFGGPGIEEAVPKAPEDSFDFFLAEPGSAETSGSDPAAAATAHREPRLFPSTKEFAEAAFAEIYDSPQQRIGLHYAQDTPDLLVFRPERDLQRRLSVLPQGYLDDHEVMTELRVTFSKTLASARLEEARSRGATRSVLKEAASGGRLSRQQRSDSSGWPDVSYLTDQHPVIEWLVDKTLTRLSRNTAPVVPCAVTEPTVLLQGLYSNAHGRPTILAYRAVSGLPDTPVFEEFIPVLDRALLSRPLVNVAGSSVDASAYRPLVVPAVEAMRDELRRLRAGQEDELQAPLIEYEKRLARWRAERELRVEQLALFTKEREKTKTQKTAAEMDKVIDALATSGEPMVRVLGVLVPPATSESAGMGDQA